MANYFDQYDAPPAPQPSAPSNYFDQFDQPAYHGSILPFSTDAQGKASFDPTAGVLGSIINAVKLPSDVVSGQQPVVGANGRTDPTLNSRAYNFASIASPVEFGSRVPGAADLKNAGVAGYDAFRNSGIEISPSSVGSAINGVKQGLENDGIIAELAPKTFAGINKGINDAAAADVITPANMQALRRTFGSVSGDKTDMLAATRAKQGIDQFLSGLSSSDLLSGSAENAARRFGNLLGGGQGMHGGMFSVLGSVLGSHFGPEGAGVGAAVPLIAGGAAKSLEGSLAQRALNPVDEMMRMRSPLAAATQYALPPLTHSGVVTRALLPGLLDYMRNGSLPPAMPQGGGLLPGA